MSSDLIEYNDDQWSTSDNKPSKAFLDYRFKKTLLRVKSVVFKEKMYVQPEIIDTRADLYKTGLLSLPWN